MRNYVFLILLCFTAILKNLKEINEGNNLYNTLVEATVCIICLVKMWIMLGK